MNVHLHLHTVHHVDPDFHSFKTPVHAHMFPTILKTSLHSYAHRWSYGCKKRETYVCIYIYGSAPMFILSVNSTVPWWADQECMWRAHLTTPIVAQCQFWNMRLLTLWLHVSILIIRHNLQGFYQHNISFCCDRKRVKAPHRSKKRPRPVWPLRSKVAAGPMKVSS